MNFHKNIRGLVTKKFNEFYYVDLQDNLGFYDKKRFLCKSRKSIRFKNDFIAVGDEVVINQIDYLHKTAVITNLIPRKNLLDRPAVANLSDVYVTYSVEEPKLNFSQVSKLLINAEYLNVNVSLILTKCDLINKERRNYLIEKFKDWGYYPKTLNLQESSAFINLLNELKSKKCSILMGPSGVGKTTLLNKIIPHLNNPTASVSLKIKQGKNTTRNVELFSLSKNSYIVDTPGFNLHKIEIESNYIPFLFPEIYNQFEKYNYRCKFNDCLHIDEPGCVIDKNFDRYKLYRDLINEAKNLNYQNLGD
mgnify:CR=1 FL=1